MREICIADNGFSSNFTTFKNSILRRAPYRRSYIILYNQATDYKYIGNVRIHKHFPIIQLKICKVS
jgi:hypothetical protein